MEVTSLVLTNFSSYQTLEFNFDGQGLSLIHGATGSGKSTLCDAIPWVLFGETSKGGSVDEVLSWPGTNITEGTINVTLGASKLVVYRARGPKPKDNDLVLIERGIDTRGKDLRDTQRLINSRLGFDLRSYLAGAYFHEFCETAQFFTATAKNRRALCEQLVDLSLAKTLQDKIQELNRRLDKDILSNNNHLRVSTASFESVSSYLEREQIRAKNEEKDRDKALKDFESNKHKSISEANLRLSLSDVRLQEGRNKITDLQARLESHPSETCEACGSDIHDPVAKALKDALTAANYSLYSDELKHEKLQQDLNLAESLCIPDYKNTSGSRIVELQADLEGHIQKIKELSANDRGYQETKGDLELLSISVEAFRSSIIESSVKDLEKNTNSILDKHFDGEIQVEFISQENDKIEVIITKDGNKCSYTQLSKGQRQLLKLSFSVSVMKAVSNHQGISFGCAFFDEALDGLSEHLKLKAVSLFEELSLDYGSVFVVEHSESIKTFFNKRYHVSLVNGSSEIQEEA